MSMTVAGLEKGSNSSSQVAIFDNLPSQEQLVRIGRASAAPLCFLFKQLEKPTQIVFGGECIWNSTATLIDHLGKGEQVPVDFLNPLVATISVAGGLFALPSCKLVAQGYQLIIRLKNLRENGLPKDSWQTCELGLVIANNALTIFMMVSGSGAGLTLVSLSLKALFSAMHSQTEFSNGKVLEGASQVFMACAYSYKIEQIQRPVIA